MKRKVDEIWSALSNDGASAHITTTATAAATVTGHMNSNNDDNTQTNEREKYEQKKPIWTYESKFEFVDLVRQGKYDHAVQVALYQFQYYVMSHEERMDALSVHAVDTQKIMNRKLLDRMEFYKFMRKGYRYAKEVEECMVYRLTVFLHEKMKFSFDEKPCSNTKDCKDCLLQTYLDIFLFSYLLKHAKHLNVHTTTFKIQLPHDGGNEHMRCDLLLDYLYRNEAYGPAYFQNKKFDWEMVFLSGDPPYLLKKLVCRYFVPIDGIRELNIFIETKNRCEHRYEHSRNIFETVKNLIGFGCDPRTEVCKKNNIGLEFLRTFSGSSFRLVFGDDSGPIILSLRRVFGFLRCVNILYLALYGSYFRNRNILTHLLLYYAPRFYISQLYFWKDCPREFEIHKAVEWCLTGRVKANGLKKQLSDAQKRKMYVQSILDVERAHYMKNEAKRKENVAYLVLSAETGFTINDGNRIEIPLSSLKNNSTSLLLKK